MVAQLAVSERIAFQYSKVFVNDEGKTSQHNSRQDSHFEMRTNLICRDWIERNGWRLRLIGGRNARIPLFRAHWCKLLRFLVLTNLDNSICTMLFFHPGLFTIVQYIYVVFMYSINNSITFVILFLISLQIYSTTEHTNSSYPSNPSTPVGSPPPMTGKKLELFDL